MTGAERARKSDLLKAAQEAIEEAPPVAAAGRPATHWGIVGPGVVVLVLLGAWVFGTRPEWVFAPEPVVESPAVTMASMRLALIRERQRVERFRQTHGRLPESLAEAGSPIVTISLAGGPGNSYLLRAVEGNAALELHSSDNAETFLGNSLQVILNARRVP